MLATGFIILDGLVSEKVDIAKIFIGVCYIPLGIHFIRKSRSSLKNSGKSEDLRFDKI